MDTGYQYDTARTVEDSTNAQSAIERSMQNYLQDQLGWSPEACKLRTEKELNRTIPKSYFDDLEASGWDLRGARVLDVGAGQGAALVELLSRGADAVGVEPGPEFTRVARMRLEEDGYDPARLLQAPGEHLPFADSTFDYIISLQVLEHVRRPAPILAEMWRVLKPGGQCYIQCENYLSFREQHYRTRWLPLLPKSLGSIYLRRIGRDPSFLHKYVFYTTYPQILFIAKRLGFQNWTIAEDLTQSSASSRGIGEYQTPLPLRFQDPIIAMRRMSAGARVHARNLFKTGITLRLKKGQIA